MGKSSRRASRRSREAFQDIVDDDDEFVAMEEGLPGDISYRKVFVVMLFSMLLMYIPWVCERGSKGEEIKRDRKPVEESVDKALNENMFRRIYRMSRASFYNLHSLLEPQLNKIFFPKGGGNRTVGKSSYLIDTKIRLSIALRFFAGACPYDLMQIHDVSLVSVYYSVWCVIDAINKTESLKYSFPNHDEQREIAEGFRWSFDRVNPNWTFDRIS